MLTADHRKSYIQYFLLVLFFFAFIPPAFYSMPGEGLDPSWMISLHLAWKYDLVFGKDFVFTYGPLGILLSRCPIFFSKYFFLLFDGFFLFSLLFLVKDIIKTKFNVGVILFVFLSIFAGVYRSADQLCLMLYLGYLFAFVKNPAKPAYFIQAAVLSVIGLFIKVSLGFPEIFFLFSTLAYMLFRRKVTKKMAGLTIISYLIAVWLAAWMTNVNLPGYIRGSMKLIESYSAAMYYPLGPDKHFELYAGLMIIVIFGFIGYAVFKSFRPKEAIRLHNPDELFIYGIVVLITYILFKASFVRANQHTMLFFVNMCWLSAFLYLYCPPGINRKLPALCCWIILAISFGTGPKLTADIIFPNSTQGAFVPLKIREVSTYFHQFEAYDSVRAASDRSTMQPNEYKEVIGDHTVDIFPYEISWIYFNGLHYRPRPVIQSYAVYNDYLQDLNYQRYSSPEAPDFILFGLYGTDNRDPFFDESKTYLPIISRYEVVKKVKFFWILKKRATPLIMTETKKEVIYARLGEDIPVKKTAELQFAKIYIRYNLKGKLKWLFYHPPVLNVTITPENGRPSGTYRAIVPVLAQGILINKNITEDWGFSSLLQGEGKYESDISRIRFDSDPPFSGFDNDIRIEITYYSFGRK